jgi:hypothetical protein
LTGLKIINVPSTSIANFYKIEFLIMKFNEIKTVVVASSIINNERFFVIKVVYFTLFLYGIIPTMIFHYFPT